MSDRIFGFFDDATAYGFTTLSDPDTGGRFGLLALPEPGFPGTKGLSRLAYQFNNSRRLQELLAAFLRQMDELYVSADQLYLDRYLDTAQGKQLDGIGEIVGQPRIAAVSDDPGAFGFLNDPTSEGFGTLYDTAPGGPFALLDVVRGLVDDDQYRLLIRAKIFINSTSMTVDDTLRIISFTFGGAQVRYFLPDDLRPRYDIGKYIGFAERELFRFFPILIGIDRVTYGLAYNGAESFSFAGDPEGEGFGTLSDPEIGGNLSLLISESLYI